MLSRPPHSSDTPPPGASPRSPRRRWTWLVGAGVVLLLLLVLRSAPTPVEHYLASLRAQGAKLTLEELGLRRTSRYNPVIEEIRHAAELLQPLHDRPLSLPYVSSESPTNALRIVGWTLPRLHTSRNTVHYWGDLEPRADAARIPLADLYRALQILPDDPGFGYGGSIPNFISLRQTAQDLHTLVLVELHRGHLETAHTNLVCLFRIGLAYEKNWTLVGQALRSAVLGLATDATWDALQAPGWTDEQLAEWQQALQSCSVLPFMPRAFELERCSTDEGLQKWIAEGPDAYVAQFRAFYGIPPSLMQLRLAHTFTRMFRAGSDRLRLLQHNQRVIDTYEALLHGAPARNLDFNPPVRHLWSDSLIEHLDPQGRLFPFSHVPLFSRLAETILRNDTRRRLAITAIALERHHLRHGQLPDQLTDLTPDLLSEVPRDLWTCASLRYQRLGSDPPLLYSTGPNGRDDTLAPNGQPWPRPPRNADDAECTWRRPLLLLEHPPSPVPRLISRAANQGDYEPETALPLLVSTEVLPIIQFEECPLLDGVHALARQAGLIVQVDPSIQSTPFPNLSLRLENVTAYQVLQAVIVNHDLTLEQLTTNVWRLRK